MIEVKGSQLVGGGIGSSVKMLMGLTMMMTTIHSRIEHTIWNKYIRDIPLHNNSADA